MFLGIEDHIWIIGIVFGALVSTSVNQMRPKRNIPLAEIYLKKGGAIVWFAEGRTLWPFALKKTKQGYFPMYRQNIKGIFHLDPSKWFNIAGSNIPNYLFSVNEMNNYDLIEAGLANEFLDKNNIYKMERKHITQGKKLRHFISRFKNTPEAMQALEAKSIVESEEMEDALKSSEESSKQWIDNYNIENNSDYTLDEKTKMHYIVDYLLRHDMIDDKIAETLIFKIENGIINLDGFRNKIAEMPNVEIIGNMDISIQRFFEEFGSENPLELTGIIDDAISNKKELKKMTPVPVKQFIPGGVILGIGIVGLMALVLLSQGSISGDMFGNLGIHLPGQP